MQVLALNPETPISERFVVKEIESGLNSLQAEVDGPIEFFSITINDQEYDIVLNEEGKLNDLKPGIAIFSRGVIADIIVGKVIIVKADDEGRTIGLTDEDIESIKEYFSSTPKVIAGGGFELFSYHFS